MSIFAKGDRVRIDASEEVYKRWGSNLLRRQQSEHPGWGHIAGYIVLPAHENTWVWVEFLDGYRNNYPMWALTSEELTDDYRMPEPDISLEEIELANTILQDLQKAH